MDWVICLFLQVIVPFGAQKERKNEMPKGSVVIGTLAPILLNFYLCYEVIGAADPNGAMSCY